MSSADGSFLEGQAGLEARACLFENVCAIGGLDVGVRHIAFDETALTRPIVVPRAMLDFGSGTVHVRPGAELLVDGAHDPAIALTSSVAIVW